MPIDPDPHRKQILELEQRVEKLETCLMVSMAMALGSEVPEHKANEVKRTLGGIAVRVFGEDFDLSALGL